MRHMSAYGSTSSAARTKAISPAPARTEHVSMALPGGKLRCPRLIEPRDPAAEIPCSISSWFHFAHELTPPFHLLSGLPLAWAPRTGQGQRALGAELGCAGTRPAATVPANSGPDTLNRKVLRPKDSESRTGPAQSRTHAVFAQRATMMPDTLVCSECVCPLPRMLLTRSLNIVNGPGCFLEALKTWYRANPHARNDWDITLTPSISMLRRSE